MNNDNLGNGGDTSQLDFVENARVGDITMITEVSSVATKDVEMVQLNESSDDSSPSFMSARENSLDETNKKKNDGLEPETMSHDKDNQQTSQSPMETDPTPPTPNQVEEPNTNYHNPTIIKLPSALHKEPYFKFGPYIPLLKRNNEIIINSGGMVKEYVDIDKSSLAKRLNREMLPEDAILEAPSLVTPLLLKKRTKWPARMRNVALTPSERSPTSCQNTEDNYEDSCSSFPNLEEENEYIICNQRIPGEGRKFEIVKILYRSEHEDPLPGKDTFRRRSDYIRHATVIGLTKDQSRSQQMPLAIKDFTQTSTSDFLMELGLNQVKEFTLDENCRKLNRKIKRDNNAAAELIELSNKLHDELDNLKILNDPFRNTNPKLTCHKCEFNTNSIISYAAHLEYPHMKSRKEFSCNWCDFKSRDPNNMTFHNMVSHKKRCRYEKPASSIQCIYCPFEANKRKRAFAHLEVCEKNFNLDANLAPHDYDLDNLPAITSKPITREDLICHDQILKDIRLSNRNLNRMRISNGADVPNPMINQNGINTTNFSNDINISVLPKNNTITTTTTSTPKVRKTMITSNCIVNMTEQRPQERHQSENSQEHTFVICEICDSYISDLQQLKFHMQMIHKIRIQQKVLETRPPLSCQKCQWRFFTDQGLERHLLGLHGLVTSTLQNQVDLDCDSGRCTKCGRAFANKLVSHMKETHKLILKSAHLTYKCLGCGACFNLYRLFENHVYSVHGQSLKKNKSINNINSNMNQNTNKNLIQQV